MFRKIVLSVLFIVLAAVALPVFASHTTVYCDSSDQWCTDLVEVNGCYKEAERGDMWEVWCPVPSTIPQFPGAICEFDIDGTTPYDGACAEQMATCQLVGVIWTSGTSRQALFNCPASGASAPEVPYAVQAWVMALEGNFEGAGVMSTYVGEFHLESFEWGWALAQIEYVDNQTKVHLYDPESFVQITYWESES